MRFPTLIFIAAIALFAPNSMSYADKEDRSQSASEQGTTDAYFQGTWEGGLESTVAYELSFELTKHSEGDWTGRWQSKQKQLWQDMLSLEVTSSTVVFSMEGEPRPVIVSLSVNEDGLLVGEADIGFPLPASFSKLDD